MVLYEGLTAEEWAITLLQKEWVFANCLLAILTLLIVHVGEKIIMNSSRNVFYSKIRLSDRVWVLLNLNFVCLFLLVIGTCHIKLYQGCCVDYVRRFDSCRSVLLCCSTNNVW